MEADQAQAPEHFDSENDLDEKAEQLADMIRAAKKIVWFTGAGISANAGVPEFYGLQGWWWFLPRYVWVGYRRPALTRASEKCMPTFTHMALFRLQEDGKLLHLISQNMDGLHLRSGILPQNLSEVRGNAHLERCSVCKHEYLRDFRVGEQRESDADHRTGRKCAMPGCNGDLLDNLVVPGAEPPEEAMERAWSAAADADLHIVLGSSLSVRPECHMPYTTKENGGKLVICNTRKTELDTKADLRIFARSDELMRAVMEKLGLDVPQFILHRGIHVRVSRAGDSEKLVTLIGTEANGTPSSFIREVRLKPHREAPLPAGQRKVLNTEPFNFRMSAFAPSIELEIFFYGHFNEEPITLRPEFDNDSTLVFKLEYDPYTCNWSVPETLITPAEN